MMIIHYAKASGKITSWGNAEPLVYGQSHFDDHEVLRTSDANIDPLKQKVDLQRMAVVDMTAEERHSALIPILDQQVRIAVGQELSATDQYMVPDRDVENREAWTVYRKQLRALSRKPDITAMIADWPARPDGVDPIQHLRMAHG